MPDDELDATASRDRARDSVGRNSRSSSPGRARVEFGFAALALGLAATSSCHARSVASELPLRLVADVPLGKSTGRFDYESVDSRNQGLFIADLARGVVVDVDTRANRLRSTILDVPQVHGVIAVPEQGRIYATATGANQMVSIDEATGQVVARAPAGDYPDGLAFVPPLNKVYVSDERGKTVAVIDVAHDKLLRLIPLGGEVGNTQFDAADGLVYSNDQTHNELVAIDPVKDTVTGRWRWLGCEGSHGLQLDTARQLAYAACEDNRRLATMSLADHRQLSVQDLAGTPDVIAADFGLGRLYVAAESGAVSVFDIAGRTPRMIAEAKLADNAHVVAVDPATHRVYFPLRNVDGLAVLRVMAPVK